MYNALIVLLRPAQMSLTLLAALQQSAQSLRWSLYFINMRFTDLQKPISDMQQFNELQNLTKVIKDGEKSYPNECESPKGMAVELKYVL